MNFEELIKWNKRIRIIKPKIRKATEVGKTMAKVVFYTIAIAYGLGSPYLLFDPREHSRRRLYLSRSSLENSELLPDENPDMVRKNLHYLNRKKYVIWKLQGNEILLKLTKEGEKHFGKCLFEDIVLPREEKWDGYWRFFIFDIPEKYKVLRDMLRDKLKKVGFFRIQHSVWVYPHECENEMNFICDYLDVNSYIIMFSAKIKNDVFLKNYFIKKKFRL